MASGGAPAACRGRRVEVVMMLALLVLCFFHAAVCVSASPAVVPRKANLSGRKGGLAAASAAAVKDQTGVLKHGKKLSSGDVITANTKLLKEDKAAKLMTLAKIGTKKSPEHMLMAKTKKPSEYNFVDVMKIEESGKKAEATAAMKTRKSAEEVAAALAEEDGAEDLISEFRDLPARLQETLVPDLARLSSTSRAYLSAANAGIADGVRPLLGGRWAPVAAPVASAAVLLLPLCLLAALVRRVGAYLPLLRRALLLAQAYLAIYFATLALAAAATGLEPLRFFHAASPAAYAWTQAAQSLGYVAYLVLQMVDLVAAFSSPDGGAGGGAGEDASLSSRALSLAQMLVGLAVGLHYYAAVFHRAAAGEAPRATWRVHAVYAACFVVVCACARAERRKKVYLAGAAETWKKS
uniref:Uncharacterized protein n=1 Tax=Oryza punctata TaxID=4537 RepID=A0A0E0M0J5_ORYPU